MLRAFLCLALSLGGVEGLAGEYVVTTVAGTGAAENNGDAGMALTTNIGAPFGVVVGPDGALYITEVHNHRVRRLNLHSGELTTVAGSGRQGYSGDGGPATQAELNEPYEMCFDRGGNLYVVEMKNHVVRRIDAKTQVITTIAGTGRPGFEGDGGPATKALLRQPHSIALDDKGALYIADIGNRRIRKVDPVSGAIESIAGNGDREAPQDGQAAFGNSMVGPRALCIDRNMLWIALREGHSVWRMDLSDGVLHHVAGAGVRGYSGDGGPAARAKLNGPKGIAIDRTGNVFIVDSENNAVRRIDRLSGEITTIAGGGSPHRGSAGDDGPASSPQLNQPHGVCVGPGGEIYVGDTLNHRVLRIE
jgi:DNA-binding beta-propeller fold protein YncE